MFESVCSAFLKSRSHSQYANKHQVLVNVYDMLEPSFLTHVGHALGVGIYHSGVEIGGREYCFGGHEYDNLTGVFSVEPKVGPPGVLYKQTILIGYVDMTETEISQVLQAISQEFMGTSYNLLTRNCNHFTEELCRRLCNKSSPGWINRAAKLGTMFPCVIPDEWVEPPEFETDPTVQSPTSFGSSQPASPAMSYSSRTPLKSTSMRGRRSSSRQHEQYGSSHNSTMVSSNGSRPTSPTSITLGRKSNQQPLQPTQSHQQQQQQQSQRQQPQVSQSSPTSRQSSKASFDLRTFQHAAQHHRRRSSVPSSCASPSRRPSGAEDRDSIVLIRASSPLMMMQDDDFDADDPVKEPDCARPEVIRSATQLSISASLQELDRPLSANGREPVSPVSPQ